MIKIIKRGDYQLVEMKNFTKVFVLDNNKAFEWSDTNVEFFEDISTIQDHVSILAKGKYFLYDVHDEDSFADTQHWELFLGKRTWQGYLLPEGLPTKKNRKKTIIPTPEIITRT